VFVGNPVLETVVEGRPLASYSTDSSCQKGAWTGCLQVGPRLQATSVASSPHHLDMARHRGESGDFTTFIGTSPRSTGESGLARTVTVTGE
jgi:hypothetical protein